ncbi:hypothetical protein AYM00_10720 [Coxiella burnetii]|nr:hypothetical protein AYM00_10720 [Coxiella burnetii]
MDLLLFLKIEILCWRIMTPSLRGGSISLGYFYDFLACTKCGRLIFNFWLKIRLIQFHCININYRKKLSFVKR